MPTIRDILIECGVPHAGAEHRHGREGWVQVDCPECGRGTGKFHLGISLSTGAATCWRCGRKDTARVLAELTGRTRASMRERVDGARRQAPTVRKVGRLAVPACVGPLGPAHHAYLVGRGLDVAQAVDEWGAGGIGQATGKWRHLRWRIYIPIHYHGEVVSWTTRSVQPGAERRYMSAALEQESVHHKDLLYGADYAKHSIIIHEGPLDVWRTGPGAVATLGTGFTEAQLVKMSRYLLRAVCFDVEPEAQRRARGLANMLSVYPGETVNVILETGKDAAEADDDELIELRRAFL